ncbi:SRPBCC family protein [Ktedonosporobacter rubrisoli]|uniref:SRPBCC family protein n=1 Tax=Ktedonosporobacter rubrisoli TaxID=2509675 RepID=A0A4P6K026_KTERU|nr:SRPBCC family protein [Ktedonosporobacter rubrisoli]QBD81528.1 SRPBCC family protein [Ktedonosporobacter rubrisoli]
MAEHCASVEIKAPVHQVYELFTHFNDFPKFMRFVKEVTYYDEQRSHWVVQVFRRYEWDAVNEDWIPDRQVGWRSIRGLKNSGRVKFRALSPQRTCVDVYIYYSPPSGALGGLGETFGISGYFETCLKEDLQNFARMVEEAPAGALDPMSSHYLFHPHSASARGEMTERQRSAMAHDPMMSPQALREREARIRQEEERARAARAEREAALKRRSVMERQAMLERQTMLARSAERRLEEQKQRDAALRAAARPHEIDPVYDTIGGRNAALDRTALGDKDALRLRYPKYEQDPMTARYPLKAKDPTGPLDPVEKLESPWFISIRGNTRPLQ